MRSWPPMKPSTPLRTWADFWLSLYCLRLGRACDLIVSAGHVVTMDAQGA